MIKISQWFGANPQNYGQFGLPGHEGLDFPVPTGTPVYAAANGTVSLVVTNPNVNNYGVYVKVDHGDGYESTYAHLSSVGVTVGDQVSGGEAIGLSGNTGNSTGPHLHFGEKGNAPYTDENGAIWPNFHRDPWLHLKHLYAQWLNNNGVAGYLWTGSLSANLQGEYAFSLGTLNIRETPSASGNLMGKVTTYTVVKITGPAINGYYPVLTPIDIPVSQPSPVDYGLHLRADPAHPLAGEWSELVTMNATAVKFLHAHPDNVVPQSVATIGEDGLYVIRIFQSWGTRHVTPQEFVQWNKDETIKKVNLLRSHSVPASSIYVELHNEPNLGAEGWRWSWANGSGFMQFCHDVMDGIPLPTDVNWLYPGLSPGGSVGTIRYDAQAFLQEGLWGMSRFDAVGIHVYWSDTFPMATGLAHLDTTNAMVGQPLIVTECSRNDNQQKPIATYGADYAEFIRQCRSRNKIQGVTFFIGSASYQGFKFESWVTENNIIKGIASELKRELQ